MRPAGRPYTPEQGLPFTHKMRRNSFSHPGHNRLLVTANLLAVQEGQEEEDLGQSVARADNQLPGPWSLDISHCPKDPPFVKFSKGGQGGF